MTTDLDERVRQALAPLESMPPLRRPVGAARAPRRWAPLAIAATCVAALALGVGVVVARRPAPNPPPAATTVAPAPRTAVVVVDPLQGIRLDGQVIGKGSNAVFSPDGRSVAFQSEGADGLAVRIYDGDTGAIATVLEAGGMYVHPWSPDGRLLAVSTWDGVHVVDRSGRAVFAVSDSGGDPVFSPDGSQIAYPTAAGVATMSVAGGRPTIVLPGTANDVARPIAWRADGLVVLDGREIVVTGTGRRITLPGDPMDEGIAPIPIPGSADGRIVAFSSFTTEGGQPALFSASIVDTDTGHIRTIPGTVQGLTPDGLSLLVASQSCNSSADQSARSLAVLDLATLTPRQTIADACGGAIATVRDATPLVPPASTTPVPLAAAPRCRGDDLRLSLAVTDPTGHLTRSVVAENAARQTCDLDGRVSIAAVDASGAPVPATVDTTLKAPQVTKQVGRSPVHWLDPGGRARVYVKLSAGCWPPGTVFWVTLPDDSRQNVHLGDALHATCDGLARPALSYEPRFEPS